MSTVSLTIAGRLYEVACQDTQVDHLRALAARVDGRAESLLKQLGLQPEARLLLMVALTLADELADTQNARDQAQALADKLTAADAGAASAVMELAERIESIARRLDRT